MRFGCEVNYSIKARVLKQGQQKITIGYIPFNKPVVRQRVDILEICKIACIGEAVEIGYCV